MLDAAATSVSLERSTRKNPLNDDDVAKLLESVDRVVITRGRSRREVPATEVELSALKGPTGNYRAPMLMAEGTLLVGFSLEALDELLAG